QPALEAFGAALAVDPDSLEARLEHAIALFECGRFDNSKAELTELLHDEPEHAPAWQYLGLIFEREDNAEQAAHSFEMARSIDPEGFPRPTRLSDDEFDQAVADAITRLPPAAQAELGNVTIAVEALPSREDLDGGRLSPLMLGVFQ